MSSVTHDHSGGSPAGSLRLASDKIKLNFIISSVFISQKINQYAWLIQQLKSWRTHSGGKRKKEEEKIFFFPGVKSDSGLKFTTKHVLCFTTIYLTGLRWIFSIKAVFCLRDSNVLDPPQKPYYCQRYVILNQQRNEL